MPADPAIPVGQVPVQSHMTRSFQLDALAAPARAEEGACRGFLTLAAYLGVGGISFALIFVVGWGLGRLRRLGGRAIQSSPEPAAARKPKRETGSRPATA